MLVKSMVELSEIYLFSVHTADNVEKQKITLLSIFIFQCKKAIFVLVMNEEHVISKKSLEMECSPS